MIVNIFGKGEVYKQIAPLLEEQNIQMNYIVDDFSETDADTFLFMEGNDVVFCVGYKDLHKRLMRFRKLLNNGIRFFTFKAGNAIISKYAKLGEGIIINQGAIIDNFVSIGDACFINIGAMISHDVRIGEGVFVAPGANILGFTTIGDECFIGANATIIDHVNLGNHVVVAAGAVVIKDVPDNVMVAGNPAVIKKYLA
jgi:sugar O-acyltransferase (sialic acid O-acetyltransferase NeuD family)